MRIFICKYTGKSRLLFPFLFICLVSSLQADWTNMPETMTGFHAGPDITLERQSPEKTFCISQQIDDIYRNIVDKSIGSSVFSQKTLLYVNFPCSLNKSSQTLTLKSSFLNLKSNNRNDDTAVRFNLANKGVDNTIIWTVSDGTGFLGIGLRYADQKSNGDINILDFPISQNETLNEYFLDLLPETFGSTVGVSNRLTLSDISISGSTKIPGHYLRFIFNRRNAQNKPEFHYINSSSTPTLSGKRLLGIPIQLRQYLIAVTLIPEKSVISHFSLDLFKTNLGFSTDYHTYDAVDMDDLGNGQLARTGAAFRITSDIADNSFYTGISFIRYTGDFTVKTPLLGYASDPLLGLQIIPVAHWAEAQLGQSRSFAQLFGWSGNITFSKTVCNLGLQYIHSRYNFQVKGKAHLEFGLTSSPIDYPVTLNASFFTFRGSLHHRFKYFSVFYSGTQIIPYIKRVDDSPIKIHQPVAGKKVRRRGGQSHHIGLEYSF